MSEDEWYEKLTILINDAKVRVRMGAEGRKIAEERYSFRIAYPKLKKNLEMLLDEK